VLADRYNSETIEEINTLGNRHSVQRGGGGRVSAEICWGLLAWVREMGRYASPPDCVECAQTVSVALTIHSMLNNTTTLSGLLTSPRTGQLLC